jgi:hypothetical protein
MYGSARQYGVVPLYGRPAAPVFLIASYAMIESLLDLDLQATSVITTIISGKTGA